MTRLVALESRFVLDWNEVYRITHCDNLVIAFPPFKIHDSQTSWSLNAFDIISTNAATLLYRHRHFLLCPLKQVPFLYHVFCQVPKFIKNNAYLFFVDLKDTQENPCEASTFLRPFHAKNSARGYEKHKWGLFQLSSSRYGGESHYGEKCYGWMSQYGGRGTLSLRLSVHCAIRLNYPAGKG